MPQRVIPTTALMRPIADFSHAAMIDDVIYVGALAGTDADRQFGGTVPGRHDTENQARRMFDNLEIALGQMGARLDDLVQLKTYLVDLRDIDLYRRVFDERFGEAAPAHAVAGSWHFPLPQATIELDAIAIKGGGARRHRSADLPPLPSGGPNAGLTAGGFHAVTALPLRADGTSPEGDAAAQCALVLENLHRALRAAGLDPSTLFRLHVTIADPRLLPVFDQVFAAVAPRPYPARTVTAVALERADLLVQLEALAAPGGFHPIGAAQPWLGPASPAALVGETLFTSAQQGLDAGGPWRDAQAQADTAWDRTEALLGEAGMGPGTVLRTNNALSHWQLFPAFNRAYGPRVAWPFPPRTTILAALGDPMAQVQIEVIARRRAEEAAILQVPPEAPAS
ncbi:RidA family protein [Roseomonas chloroacetimidivorans]|uniref:RidA family protein n=1 Tax=Roseomonas chloroacetimidivorans TaxID=1766656 RepID=UPI003C71EECA